MNIKLTYLYRDGGNYKNFNEVIFTNEKEKDISEIRNVIKSKLIDDRWFYADQWGLPDLHFIEYKYDRNVDVDWHELENIELTDDISSDSLDIETLLKVLRSVK